MNKPKRGPKPKKRREVILNLRSMKEATSAELAVPTSFMHTLLQDNLVTRAGFAPTGGKGRPKAIWKLSKRGQGMALNFSKAV